MENPIVSGYYAGYADYSYYYDIENNCFYGFFVWESGHEDDAPEFTVKTKINSFKEFINKCKTHREVK